MSEGTSDFDGAWKETLEFFLPGLLELLFAPIADRIDRSKGFHFLDTELQSLQADTQSKRQSVDKLIKVHLDGIFRWILVHIEVQSQPDPHFPKRMFRYFYRILDVHGLPVVSLAILSDAEPNFRPGPFELDTAGTRCVFYYHTAKLLDLDEAMLEQSSNPVAKVILAHRIAQQTAGDDAGRLREKLRWFRELMRQGFSGEEIHRLLKALDAMNPLPRDLAVEFRQQIIQCDPSKIMPLLTSFEQMALEEGLEKGLEKGIEKGRAEGLSKGLWSGQLIALRESIRDLLEERFGFVNREIIDRLEAVSDPSTLRLWNRRAVTIETPEAFRVLIES